jgi:hypothetical protein
MLESEGDRAMRRLSTLFLAPWVLCLLGGCVELRQVLLDAVGADSTAGFPLRPGFLGDLFDGSGNADADTTVDDGTPRVQLRLLSLNAYPVLFEEVDLQCSVTDSNSSLGVTFSFQGFDRLAVDELKGNAYFIVAEEDLGREIVLTCTGTNEAGTGEASNKVSIIPTSGTEVPEDLPGDASPGDGQTDNGQAEDGQDLP